MKLIPACLLVILGAVLPSAWQNGSWATVAGIGLTIVWLLARLWRTLAQMKNVSPPELSRSHEDESAALRLVLDQLPMPLLAIDADAVHALNRAARALFATDDRVLPRPPAFTNPAAEYLMYNGRRWRIARIEAPPLAQLRTVAVLVDVELEERAAEAHATAEMYQVLGHELLNGLAPIVSLAESGVAALDLPTRGDAFLREILTTLARRSDGLLRFTEAYRAMTRLPELDRGDVGLTELAGELSQLFTGHWGRDVALDVELDLAAGSTARIDREQVVQALWALLQNAAEAMEGRPAARVVMTVRLEEARLEIDVTDDGDGISADDAPHVFRPFYSTKAVGTGIGLSLARQIAHAHRGTLELVSSKPALFRLTIPMR